MLLMTCAKEQCNITLSPNSKNIFEVLKYPILQEESEKFIKDSVWIILELTFVHKID